MSYTQLWLFVEGDDDKRFFEEIVVQRLRGEHYDRVQFYEYARKKDKTVAAFLTSLHRQGIDFILVGDINSYPCVTFLKHCLQEKYEVRDLERILVVVLEIESWYLAGVNSETGQKLGLRSVPRRTDDLSKEKFNSFRPSHYRSNITFMSDILDGFSVSVARNKNQSFRYFTDKYDLSN